MLTAQPVLIAAALGTSLLAQAVRGPLVVAPGSCITIEVGTNAPTVTLLDPATGDQTSHPVTPGKEATIPIPNAPGGTILHIRIGNGFAAHIIALEVVSPAP
ncbi:MAG: hypothetical protein KDE27_14750 [Planctomycetes bacterium]|nr:hypothetical protein [Planctomycetota bacterium]